MTGFNELMGLRIVGPVDGRFVVELDADERHLHGQGRVHGGVIMALLDTAMARAARRDGDAYAPTIELKTSFLRPAGPGRLTARARMVRDGRRLAFAEAELHDGQGRCLATSSATFLRAGRL